MWWKEGGNWGSMGEEGYSLKQGEKLTCESGFESSEGISHADICRGSIPAIRANKCKGPEV